MRRVVEMLSASRSTVATSSTVGKAENSSGFWIHSATIRISTEIAIDSASPKSIINDGTGRKNRHSTATMPTAKAMSAPERAGAAGVIAVDDKTSAPLGDAAGLSRVRLARTCERDRSAVVAALDLRVNPLGEDVELRAHERGRQAEHDENDDQLRHEGERHLLH